MSSTGLTVNVCVVVVAVVVSLASVCAAVVLCTYPNLANPVEINASPISSAIVSLIENAFQDGPMMGVQGWLLDRNCRNERDLREERKGEGSAGESRPYKIVPTRPCHCWGVAQPVWDSVHCRRSKHGRKACSPDHPSIPGSYPLSYRTTAYLLHPHHRANFETPHI